MQGLINDINVILDFIFIVLNALFFYFSLKKCFLKGNKGKVRLFFFSILTNPFVVFVTVFFIVNFVYGIILFINAEAWDSDVITDEITSSLPVTTIMIWLIFLIWMFISSAFLSWWLKVPNKSLVTFVYLMFTIVFVCSIKDNAIFVDNPFMQGVIKTIDVLMSIISMFLLYHLDINGLSKMTDKKIFVNWKVFVLPPTLFSLFYVVFAMTEYINISKESVLVMYIFSNILLFIFIWAFYVIIQNINATNDALKAKDEVKTLSVEVMEALAHTIDAKDVYTKGHSVRVAKYSRMLAERLGLSPLDCENVYYMGLLHDIGKIGVPNEIINSTEPLTDAQYDIIKTHPKLGFDILSEIKSRPDLATGARWHHERYDGGGYPDKKEGDDIPLLARIIAVADSYDAMTSNRSYRAYLPQEKVRDELEKNKSTQFDPVVADCMIGIMDEDKDYSLHE